jgi:hypothetical protein
MPTVSQTTGPRRGYLEKQDTNHWRGNVSPEWGQVIRLCPALSDQAKQAWYWWSHVLFAFLEEARMSTVWRPHMEPSWTFVTYALLKKIIPLIHVRVRRGGSSESRARASNKWNSEDIKPCSPLKLNRSFRGTYCLHLQGRKIRQARNQRESRWQAERLLGLVFDPEYGGYMFLRNVGWLSTDYTALYPRRHYCS